MKWQPIETAPKDGREVLLWRPLAENSGDKRLAIKQTTLNQQFCWPATIPDGYSKEQHFNQGAAFATHWMPLPEAP